MRQMNLKVLGFLSAAHFVTDLNQGALPALLPFFKESLHLSYTMAGAILLSANLTSSIIQPLFGHLSDRKPIGWFLPLAPLIACAGISAAGLMPNYPLLLACVILSGIGIAIFHPEGFKTAHFFTGERRATGMSIFAVGGNLGIALGPIWAVTLVTLFGIRGTLGLALPGFFISAVMLLLLSKVISPVKVAQKEAKKEEKRALSTDQKWTFFLLISIATIRAWVQFGMATYIPFYYINYLKGNPLYAGKLVSTFLISGAVGTLLGAPLADRWGHKRFLSTTLLLSFPLFLLFHSSSGFLSFILIGMAGMVLISSFALTTVMAQATLPHHLGMASGMMVGFTISAGGVGVTALGAVADAWGVPAAMKAILFLPLLAFGLSLILKYPLRLKGGS